MSARVLWVGATPPKPPLPAGIELVRVPEVADAVAHARDEAFAAVVVDGADTDAVREVLGAAKASDHGARRIVAGSYDQLPELVRVVEPGLIERVLATPVRGAQLGQAVLDPDPSASVIYRRVLNAPADMGPAAVDERLRELVARIVALPMVVIRPLSPHDHVPRLQMVIPIADPLHELRRELPSLLGWPLKANGSAMGQAYRDHPLRRVLGTLSESQEVCCLGEDRFAYVAFFPWQDERKVTVVVGFAEADETRVGKLHAHAVAHAREFPLPTRHQHSPQVFYDPDYDWVITDNYVGPDRRRKSTSFLSRYTFRGRRRALMPNEFASVGTFVDVAPRWAWATAAVFALLFLFDSAMTAYFVGNRNIGELNPVMRWALGHSPVTFWLLKSALGIAAAFIVVRWHLWRPGRWLFAVSVGIYAVLDAYWVWLYLTRAVG